MKYLIFVLAIATSSVQAQTREASKMIIEVPMNAKTKYQGFNDRVVLAELNPTFGGSVPAGITRSNPPKSANTQKGTK